MLLASRAFETKGNFIETSRALANENKDCDQKLQKKYEIRNTRYSDVLYR